MKTPTILIPEENWPTALASAIERAPHGSFIEVTTENIRELAVKACRRKGREDIGVFVTERTEEVPNVG